VESKGKVPRAWGETDKQHLNVKTNGPLLLNSRQRGERGSEAQSGRENYIEKALGQRQKKGQGSRRRSTDWEINLEKERKLSGLNGIKLNRGGELYLANAASSTN